MAKITQSLSKHFDAALRFLKELENALKQAEIRESRERHGEYVPPISELKKGFYWQTFLAKVQDCIESLAIKVDGTNGEIIREYADKIFSKQKVKKRLLSVERLIGTLSGLRERNDALGKDDSGKGSLRPKQRRRRTRKGEPKHWHNRARRYLQATNAEISDAELARLLGIKQSVLSRDPTFKALRRSYVVKEPLKQIGENI